MSRIMRADLKQQELLHRFFKEERTWWPEYVGYQAVAVIFIGISMILGIMPYQVWDFPGDTSVYSAGIMLYLLGVTSYMQRYNNYAEGGKMKAVSDILRYLPVSHKQFQIYIMKKILKLCGCATMVSAACQTVSAMAFMHDFSAGNVLLPIAVNFILPVLYTGICTAVRA